MRGVPLLAALAAGASFACGGDATARTGTADAPAPSECPPTRAISEAIRGPVPLPTDDFVSLASDLPLNIMDVYCTGCHAPGAAEPAPSGPSDASDFNAMIDEGFVVDCDAERSPIIISMRAGDMPPLDYFGISATPSDIDVVVTFIELDCSDVEKACADSPSEPGCDDVLAARRAWRCGS